MLRAQGISLLTVESRFGSTSYELPDGPGVVRCEGGDVMWQKERMLNIGVAALPASVRYVVLTDNDILFERDDWASAVRAALSHHAVIQPFSQVARLPRSGALGGAQWRASFAATVTVQPLMRYAHGPLHGEPGIAFAARREFLDDVGIYDAEVAGNGDELFMHGIVGGRLGFCARTATGGAAPKLLPALLRRAWHHRRKHLLRSLLLRLVSTMGLHGRLTRRSAFQRHYLQWARSARRASGGRIGAIDGTVRHLWHGDLADRNYRSRHELLTRHAFDPAVDLMLDRGGMWRWNSEKPDMHAEVAAYFGARREDGPGTTPVSA